MPVKEIRITCAAVSPELTESASLMLLRMFGGYYRTDGQGAFTFPDGSTVQEPSVSWRIAVHSNDRASTGANIRTFARGYCAAGAQAAVYVRDVSGLVWLADINGNFSRPTRKG